LLNKTGSIKQGLAEVRGALAEIANTAGFLARTIAGEYQPPPHCIKMQVLRSYVQQPESTTLIETGTYFGQTVQSLKSVFQQVISIEIDPDLYGLAQQRFTAQRNVRLILGDCVNALPGVLAELNVPAVFWLDGHWSGGVTGRGTVADPILISLAQIEKHSIKGHVLFVDDARTFETGGSGPDLIEVLAAIRKINPDYRIRIHNDIIVACPTGDK